MQKISAGVFKNFPRFFFIPFLLAFLFLTLTACQFEDSSCEKIRLLFQKFLNNICLRSMLPTSNKLSVFPSRVERILPPHRTFPKKKFLPSLTGCINSVFTRRFRARKRSLPVRSLTTIFSSWTEAN